MLKREVGSILKKIKQTENKLLQKQEIYPTIKRLNTQLNQIYKTNLHKHLFEFDQNDKTFLANLKTAHENIYKLHDNFDHDKMEELSGKIHGKFNETIREKSNTFKKQVKRERMFGNLALGGAVLSPTMLLGSGVILALAMTGVVTFGLALIPLLVGVAGSGIFFLLSHFGIEKDIELDKKNVELGKQISDLQEFKEILTPDNIRLILDCPMIENDHREKYIKVLVALENLCSL